MGWEVGSGLGTHIHPWWIHVNVWQNQHSMVKQNKVKIIFFFKKKTNPRVDLLQNELVGSPCSPRDPQESSPIPQLKTSILWHSAFFTVQLSHAYVTTGKTIALTRRTLVSKVMSLLLNMLFRLVITFLPRIKCLLISILQ